MSKPTTIRIDAQKQALLDRMEDEAKTLPPFRMILDLDLSGSMGLVGNLQLALRHPGNRGPIAKQMRGLIRSVIAGMRERGFAATAEACELGDDPTWDD